MTAIIVILVIAVALELLIIVMLASFSFAAIDGIKAIISIFEEYDEEEKHIRKTT